MLLVLEKAARKGLDKMPPRAASSMLDRLETIAVAPFARHANVKPLVGEKDAFRLRQGDWRAVYRIERTANALRVILVDVRGSVYR
jgi:mRNA-degrading endonuclease RelE of RelBE toxin-antitoxin system